MENGVKLGADFTLAELRERYDAVFLGIGLGSVNDLGIDNENLLGVENAIDYIADLRQADDKSALAMGRNVVVIGGGMTAIDIAVQSKRLGAETSTSRIGEAQSKWVRANLNNNLHRQAASRFIIGHNLPDLGVTLTACSRSNLGKNRAR